MGKIKRGGYIFVSWKGDHAPRHVHVFDHVGLILKFDLENWKVMEGRLNRKLLTQLSKLRREGLL